MRGRSPTRFLVVPAAAFVLVAAACGVRGGADATAGSRRSTTEPAAASPSGPEGGTSRTPAAAMARAASTTAAGSPARFTMDLTFTGGTVARLSYRVVGAYDTAANRARYTMDVDGALAAPGPGGPGATSPTGNDPVEVMIAGDAAYLRAAFIQRLLGGDKAWVKVPSRDAAGVAGGFGAASGSPPQMLVFLRSVSGPVVEVGQEPVRGTPTTHLRTTIDSGRLAGKRSADQAEVRKLLDRLGGGDPPGIPVDVWVDASDLVRRLHVTVDGAARPGPAGRASPTGMDQALEITVEYFDFGAPVDVTPPPPGQVLDFARIPGLGSLGELFGGTGPTTPSTRPGG